MNTKTRPEFLLSDLPWLEKPWNCLRQCMDAEVLAHGLLIHGVAGSGKTLLADHLARTLLCEVSADGGCRQCGNCHLVDAKSTSDLLTLTPEEGKREITVAQIRRLIRALSLSRQSSEVRVILVSRAEQMNRSAANALLKSLEEPTPGNLFLLLAESLDRLPATILSRVQLTPVQLPSATAACHWLQQQQCLSDHGAQLCQRALLAANGAPLLALDMIMSGEMDHYEAIISSLRCVIQQTRSPTEIAAEWHQQDLGKVFSWVQSWLSQYIKNCSQHSDNKRKYIGMLLQLYDEAGVCRRLSSSAVNTQSLAERWLLRADAVASRSIV